MKKNFTILSLCLLFIGNSVFAQPCDPLSITSSAVADASCPAGGSITVAASGTGLTYQLIEGPSGYPTTPNSTGTFNSLTAGTYKVQVRDGCGNVETITKTVANTYPDFSVTNAVISGVCESGSMGGTVTASIAGGKPGYQYDIVPAGTAPTYGATTASTSYVETVTGFGTYRVFAKDACGEVRTYDVEVLPTQPTPTSLWWEDVLFNRPCTETMDGFPTATWALHLMDQFGQGINFATMIGSTYQIYKPDPANSINESSANGNCTITQGALLTSGTVTSSNFDGISLNIVIPQEDVILVFTNKCGQTFKYCYNFFGGQTMFQDVAYSVIQQSCGATWEDQVIKIKKKSHFGLLEPIQYVLTKAGGGTETNFSGDFDNIAAADLPATIVATDACGKVVTREIPKPQKGTKIELRASPEYNLTCTNIKGTATAAITVVGGDLPGLAQATVTITGGTSTAQPALSAYQEWIPGYMASNLLAGFTYRIDFTNTCGETDFYEFTVPADQWGQPVLNWNLTATAKALCGQNKSTITALANYTGNKAILFKLLKLPGNLQVAENNSGVFNNTPPGDYKVTMFISADACPDKSINDEVLVTVIDDATGQSITSKTITTCEIGGMPTNTGKAIINVNGSGPFTYEIIKTEDLQANPSAAVWTVSASNTSSSTYTWEIPMPGDPVSTMYTLRSTDNCGNKTTTQASLQPLEPPVLEAQNHPCSESVNYTLTVRPYAGNFTYRWVKLPDMVTTLSTENKLTFPGLYTSANDGTYRCIISLDGCVERTKDIKIESANCGISLPVKLTSFSGTYNNGTAQLKWVGENEIDFSHYEIERSGNGIDFVTISNVQGRGNGASRNEYSAVDDLSSFTGNVVFYRLKLVDLDGKYTHSSIIRLSVNGKDMQLLVYPNPAKEAVSIAFNSGENTMAEIRITDQLGRVVINKRTRVVKGYNVFRLTESETLVAGFYIAEIFVSGQKETSKFIKY